MVKLQVKDEKVKYEYPDVEGQNADLKIKYAIANELAEANRLKRLELINTLPDGVSEDTINGTDKNE